MSNSHTYHEMDPQQFEDIEWQSPAHTKLWASILCNFATRTEFRDLVISELERLFSHEHSEVRKAAADVFRHMPRDDFPYFKGMAQAFVRSPAFQDTTYSIIKCLEEASHDVTELVLEAGEVIVKSWADRRVRSIYQIQKTLKREYVNSESRPELRTRYLDLIDDMAAKNVYKADDFMRMDDR